MSKSIIRVFLFTIAFFIFSCETETYNPLSPTAQKQSVTEIDNYEDLAKKGGNGNGGGKGDKEKVIYSVEIVRVTSTPLENNLLNGCPETRTSGGSYNIIWDRHGQCANVTVLDADRLEVVTLTDDPQLYVMVKRGKIVSMRFSEQDVIGAEGIQYSTENIEINPPVTPDVLGFTIPVHRDDIEVWKHKGHTGGPRVEMVGYISIGVIKYTPITP